MTIVPCTGSHRRVFLSGMALLAVAVAPAVRGQPRVASSSTILLVRHAEKAGPSGDVPLSAAGRDRARRLAAMLRDAGIRHVFTSDLIRTRQTAAPLVERVGVGPQAVAARELDTLVEKLRALPAGAVALVVHHSNTLPAIVEKLGGGKIPSVHDEEYDRLLVLTRSAQETSLMTLRY
jgi:phosphohistidine phosphatase SixA